MLLDISEVTALASDVVASSGSMEDRAQLVIAKTALDVVADAQILVRVDTGATRASTGADIGDLEFIAGPTTDYAEFLELGTSRMAPHPFMGPAFDRRLPGAVDALLQIGSQVLGS